MQRWIWVFVAGFLAVFCFHQVALGLLHAAGVVPFAPFNLATTKPLGVPSVISGAFFGGLWALVMIAVLDRIGSGMIWPKAALFGGVVLTLVALLVVFPLKGMAFAGNWDPKIWVGAALLNGAWGFGVALLMQWLGRR